MNPIEDARMKYLPEHISVLFVAQAPPDNPKRFFYYENVPEKDYLYVYLSRVFRQDYSNTNNVLEHNRTVKTVFLEQFKENGFFLMDLCRGSENIDDLISEVPFFMERLKKLEREGRLSKDTPIVLIKADVYDSLRQTLKSYGYNVQDYRISFPSCGQQPKFYKTMSECLAEIGFLNAMK